MVYIGGFVGAILIRMVAMPVLFEKVGGLTKGSSALAQS
jgi:hypothetical protein